VLLAHLVGELADGEDLLHARRRVGDEVEGAGERTDLGEQRDLQLEAQVLLERLLGVHRHRPQARLELPGREGGLPRLVEVGQVALGVDLAHEGALALLGGEQGQGCRDGGLADAALPRDEEELAVEEGDHASGYPPKPMRRPSSGRPIST
jgi:hypothetical protein